MRDSLPIRVWVEKFNDGDFDAKDVDTQIDAGWFDWFCKDSSLQKKLEVIGRKVVQIRKSKLIDIDNQYVFFKNNAPCSGGTYDSFSVCDMDKGDVQFWIGKPNYSKNWEVHGVSNEFKEALFEGSWLEVKQWFLAA